MKLFDCLEWVAGMGPDLNWMIISCPASVSGTLLNSVTLLLRVVTQKTIKKRGNVTARHRNLSASTGQQWPINFPNARDPAAAGTKPKKKIEIKHKRQTSQRRRWSTTAWWLCKDIEARNKNLRFDSGLLLPSCGVNTTTE